METIETVKTSATTERLSDQIMEFLTTQTNQRRTLWAAEGLDARNYTAAIQIVDIADALGMSYNAVNAAVGHLHRRKRIIGVAVKGRDIYTYAITLRDSL